MQFNSFLLHSQAQIFVFINPTQHTHILAHSHLLPPDTQTPTMYSSAHHLHDDESLSRETITTTASNKTQPNSINNGCVFIVTVLARAIL